MSLKPLPNAWSYYAITATPDGDEPMYEWSSDVETIEKRAAELRLIINDVKVEIWVNTNLKQRGSQHRRK